MQFQKTVRINAPIDRVWDVVAHDFADVGEWSSAVQSSGPNLEAAIPQGAEVGGRVVAGRVVDEPPGVLDVGRLLVLGPVVGRVEVSLGVVVGRFGGFEVAAVVEPPRELVVGVTGRWPSVVGGPERSSASVEPVGSSPWPAGPGTCSVSACITDVVDGDAGSSDPSPSASVPA